MRKTPPPSAEHCYLPQTHREEQLLQILYPEHRGGMALPVPDRPCRGLGTLGLCTGLCTGFCTGAGSAWSSSATPPCLEVFGDIRDTQGDVHLPVHPGRGTCETSSRSCGSATQETKLLCPGFSSQAVHQKERLAKGDQIQGNFLGSGACILRRLSWRRRHFPQSRVNILCACSSSNSSPLLLSSPFPG